jgi:two-component system, NtrC family, sensor histidine kinase KinB
MFRTLRTKLLIGLTPLLAIIVGLGLWAIVMFSRLGNNIDVILNENYASVLAAEGMKEALERIDSALLFAIGGEEQTGWDQFAEYRPVFERNLKIEQGNVTLPGELASTLSLIGLSLLFFALMWGAASGRL